MRMFRSSTCLPAARTIWLLVATGMVLLLLAGCAPDAAHTSTQTAAQTSQTPPAATSSRPTISSTPGETQSACPGGNQNVTWPSLPTVVVTLPQATTVQMKVGDTLEIVLKMNQKWTFLSQESAVLRLDNPAGYGDVAIQSCVWHFTALASGQEDVRFSAAPLCNKGMKCPAYVKLADLTVQVSSK